MDDKTPGSVPYMVYESAQARADRRLKWMWIFSIIMLIALVGTNGAWIYYESQYQDVVTETYEAQTDGGGTAIANGSGEVKLDGQSKVYENNTKSTEDWRQ